MPERQLGEVPERPASKVLVDAGASALHGHVEAHLRKVVSRMVLACVTDPALGDQRLVPAVEVEPHFTFVVSELRRMARRPFGPDDFAKLDRLADEMEARARTFGGEPDER